MSNSKSPFQLSFTPKKTHSLHVFIANPLAALMLWHKIYREHNIFQIRFIGFYKPGLLTLQVIKWMLLGHLLQSRHLQVLPCIYSDAGFAAHQISERLLIHTLSWAMSELMYKLSNSNNNHCCCNSCELHLHCVVFFQ